MEMYARKAPDARKVFNHSPESLVWSVAHRMAMAEDCEAAGKPGKLIVSITAISSHYHTLRSPVPVSRFCFG